ncbi:hypothetical protein LJR220_001224 [Bradyrhizobium sp. LjRoot220]|uniref:hypothetical protein n=1 Tax=Bradyrhizobium sp. LjRoot220 TaxID=3342284 RepID=UPI003ECFCF4B
MSRSIARCSASRFFVLMLALPASPWKKASIASKLAAQKLEFAQQEKNFLVAN